MAVLTLPKLLDIPKKLLPLITEFDRYRIFLIEGGRGGAKSHTVARFLLYLNDLYNLRTICAREVQNTINESVHQLLSDLIIQYQLNFEIQKASIKSRRKDSEFSFIGLREQQRFNIKSFEGADILWIEEGQAITKPTMDVVLPTIRKPNSKIIVTMNRHVHNDPAFVLLSKRPDCLHLNINYLENEFCTQELINEAEICRKQSEKDYQHIWMGVALDQSEDAVFSLEHFEIGKKNKHILADGYGVRVAGFDIARMGNDKSSAFIFQQMGALHWEEFFVDEWDKKDTNYTTGRILAICNEQGVDMAAVDIDGLGVGPFDTLRHGRGLEYFVGFTNPHVSYQTNRQFVNPRTANAYKLRDNLVRGHRCVKDPKTIEELLTAFKYTFDNNQRRVLWSKEKLRSEGIASPNRGDACIMAESLIGTVKEKQDRQFQPNITQYSKEDNLFGIVGIK